MDAEYVAIVLLSVATLWNGVASLIDDLGVVVVAQWGTVDIIVAVATAYIKGDGNASHTVKFRGGFRRLREDEAHPGGRRNG
jgi:hypothetical protein